CRTAAGEKLTMASPYDRTFIVDFAERLYSQAARIVALYTILGCALGLVSGGALGATVMDGAAVPAFVGFCCAGRSALPSGKSGPSCCAFRRKPLSAKPKSNRTLGAFAPSSKRRSKNDRRYPVG